MAAPLRSFSTGHRSLLSPSLYTVRKNLKNNIVCAEREKTIFLVKKQLPVCCLNTSAPLLENLVSRLPAVGPAVVGVGRNFSHLVLCIENTTKVK